MSYAKGSPSLGSLGPSCGAFVLGAVAALLGCGTGSAGNPGGPNANGGTGANGTGGTNVGSGGAGLDPSVCVQGIPATTQIPRLLNRQ